MIKINKIIPIILALTLTLGCLTIISATDLKGYREEGDYTDMKLWQEGDKAYVSAQFICAKTGKPPVNNNQWACLAAEYSDGTVILSRNDCMYKPNTPEDLYIGIPGTGGFSPMFDTDPSGYYLVGVDPDLFRENPNHATLEKIYLIRYSNEPGYMVYDRELDGPIDEYLDNTMKK